MDPTAKRAQEAYFEKPRRLKTWSGLDLKPHYGPADRSGLPPPEPPGTFPFVRGIHPDGYRGRLWTRREVCGVGGPEETNARIRYLLSEGQSAVNVIFDIPTMTGLDADHPMARREVGIQGAAVSSLADMEGLFRGIPVEEMSTSLIVTSSAAPVLLSMYLALAEGRGRPPEVLRGTIQNDALHHRYCGYPAEFAPLELGLQTAVDIIEFAARKMPKWYPINVNAYDLREGGINAAQEIAFSFSVAKTYMQEALRRGLEIDSFAPRMAFYVSCHIDLFEEVAKIRAMRRLWARLLREELGAKDPGSWKFRFGVHTAGVSLVPQQARVNLVRIAYEALAAALAGASSIHCCSYDEPISLPTKESHRLALRTQQVLAYETGVANVADPLGGSYYVESLTDRLEEEASAVMRSIDDLGGMYEAIRTGWVEKQMESAALLHQEELERGDRIMVGANAFQIPPEEDATVPVETVPPEVAPRQVARLEDLRRTRGTEAVGRAWGALRDRARESRRRRWEEGKPPLNLIPEILAAVKAGATLAETLGAMRVGFGVAYDPAGMIPPPF